MIHIIVTDDSHLLYYHSHLLVNNNFDVIQNILVFYSYNTTNDFVISSNKLKRPIADIIVLFTLYFYNIVKFLVLIV